MRSVTARRIRKLSANRAQYRWLKDQYDKGLWKFGDPLTVRPVFREPRR